MKDTKKNSVHITIDFTSLLSIQNTPFLQKRRSLSYIFPAIFEFWIKLINKSVNDRLVNKIIYTRISWKLKKTITLMKTIGSVPKMTILKKVFAISYQEGTRKSKNIWQSKTIIMKRPSEGMLKSIGSIKLMRNST